MTHSERRQILFVDDAVEDPKKLRRHCQPRSGVMVPGSRRCVRATKTKTKKTTSKSTPPEITPAGGNVGETSGLITFTSRTTSIKPGPTFDTYFAEQDPFDSLPKPANKATSALISFYAQCMDTCPWSRSPENLVARRLVFRRQTLLPLAVHNPLAYSAMLAFVSSSPIIPRHLRNNILCQQALCDALSHLSLALREDKIYDDSIIYAMMLLVATSCHNEDHTSLTWHLNGLREVFIARHSHRLTVTTDNTPRSPRLSPPPTLPIKSTPREVGFTTLYKQGLVSRDYSNPSRWLMGRARYLLIYELEPLGAHLPIETHDVPWGGNHPPPDRDQLRPFEAAVIETNILLGMCSIEGNSKISGWRNPNIDYAGQTSHCHRMLFQRVSEQDFAEVGSKNPAVLAWMAMSLGHCTRSANIQHDCAWLLMKSLNALCSVNSREALMELLDEQFCWPEVVNSRTEVFWTHAHEWYGSETLDWPSLPYIRPEQL